MVFTSFTIVCIWEYRYILNPKEDTQCINMLSEYIWYTTYFGTCAGIIQSLTVIWLYYLYIWSWVNWNTYFECCNFVVCVCVREREQYWPNHKINVLQEYFGDISLQLILTLYWTSQGFHGHQTTYLKYQCTGHSNNIWIHFNR